MHYHLRLHFMLSAFVQGSGNSWRSRLCCALAFNCFGDPFAVVDLKVSGAKNLIRGYSRREPGIFGFTAVNVGTGLFFVSLDSPTVICVFVRATSKNFPDAATT